LLQNTLFARDRRHKRTLQIKL